MKKNIILFFLAFNVGCHPFTKGKHNILILAIDHIQYADLNCHSQQKSIQKSGFDSLCKESIRFSHAYTTSLQSRSALASLLTGLYPFEHQVRSPSDDFLSNSFKTNSELAFEKGFKTIMFSNGPTASRNSGLQQGFEIFEENLNNRQQIISAKDSINDFINITSSIEKPFFSLLYFPDLFFTNKETFNELGEAKNFSFESQFDELDVNLSKLFTHLKKNNSWDNTLVILVGLNGRQTVNRTLENAFENAHKEMTQVPILIKPIRRKEDQPRTWSIDTPITLADIGTTIYEYLGERKVISSDFKRVSLINSFNDKNESQLEDRWIYSENISVNQNFQQAFRYQDTLYINGPRSGFYNTLTDTFEVNLISKNENSYQDFFTQVTRLINKTSFDFKKYKNTIAFSDLKIVIDKINKNEWEDLLELSTDLKDDDLASLSKNKMSFKNIKYKNPCLRFLTIEKPTEKLRAKRSCNDQDIIAIDEMFEFINTKEFNERDFKKYKFYSILRKRINQLHFLREQYELKLPWRIHPNKIDALYYFTLAFNLPKYDKLRAIASKHML